MGLAILLFLSATLVKAQATEPLKLATTIELPDLQGRIDDMSIDVQGQRLFVSAHARASFLRNLAGSYLGVRRRGSNPAMIEVFEENR
jgi:hypothetical protein